MSKPREPETGKIKAQVYEGLDEARDFARTLSMDQVRSGQWFLELLRRVVHVHDRNARAEYFRQKYPGITPDESAVPYSILFTKVNNVCQDSRSF